MNELKPCPFCGDRAEYAAEGEVECQTCWTTMPTLDEWNTRTGPDTTVDRGSTHWEGCEKSHIHCRGQKALKLLQDYVESGPSPDFYDRARALLEETDETDGEL